MTFHECCRAVISAAEARKNSTSLQYAATYARAGLSMTEGSELARVQAMYIHSNLAYWRSEHARRVKSNLKGWSEYYATD